MQSVMISIQPVWVENILNGEKTVEVRKSKPKLEVPFKCYIYCTQAERNFDIVKISDVVRCQRHCNRKGKVVAEFTCDNISEFTYKNGGFLINHDLALTLDSLAQSTLTDKEFREYAKGKSVYGWHISDLVIYDKPKELSEFKKPLKLDKEGFKQCSYELCPFVNDDGTWKYDCDKCTEFMEKAQIKRPPQSWCYVDGTTQEV